MEKNKGEKRMSRKSMEKARKDQLYNYTLSRKLK